VDAVLPQSSSGDEVYTAAARRVVSGARRGVSGVVLAYGATSSGKTHTMQEISSRAASELSALFGAMHFSALEVYNEELCDLLTSSHSRRSGAKTPRLLSSSSDNGASQHTTVANAREVSVESSHHLQRLLDSVQARRATGRHLMNERSSRSHLVIKLALPNGADVHLVDLAGSERVAKTGSEGPRLREGANINRSLLVLGTVLKRLSNGGTNRHHAPFRESKLTRLLAPALGGGARTSVICCVSPAASSIDQTRNTLAFAYHAKAVVNRLHVNHSTGTSDDRRERARELHMLRAKVQALNDELDAIKGDRDERDRRAKGLERLLLSPTTALMETQDPSINIADEDLRTPRRRLSWPQSPTQSTRHREPILEDLHRKARQVRRFSHEEYHNNSPTTINDDGSELSVQREEPQPDTVWRQNMLGPEADLRMQAWRQRIPPELEELGQPHGSAQEEASRQLRAEEAAFRRAPGGLHDESTEARYERLRAEYDRFQGTGDDEAAADIVDQLERVESQLETEREAESALSALQSKLTAMQSKIEKLAPQHENQANDMSPNNSAKEPSSAGSVGPSEASLSEDICQVAPPSLQKQNTPINEDIETEQVEHDGIEHFAEKTPGEDNGNSPQRESVKELQREVGEIVNEGKLLENTLTEYKEHVERAEYQKRVLIAQAMRFESCLQSASEENSKLHESLKREKDANLRAANRLQHYQQQQQHSNGASSTRTFLGIFTLWRELSVPLAHRAHFLRAFENRDTFYVEAEHRRLEWLKSSLISVSAKHAPIGHPLRGADSELAQERELLRRLMRWLSEHEQHQIFDRFGIDMKSRYRRKQVADSLFTGSMEGERAKGSAELVCKLLQLDSSHGTFGLLFAGSFTRARLKPGTLIKAMAGGVPWTAVRHERTSKSNAPETPFAGANVQKEANACGSQEEWEK